MKIGLIAHDTKKRLLQDICVAYKTILSRHDLYATATTGRLVEQATGLKVHKFLAGHIGGVEQFGAAIEENEMDLVIYLRDPAHSKSNEIMNKDILRLCDLHNIPVATNIATSELLILALDRGDFEFREAYR